MGQAILDVGLARGAARGVSSYLYHDPPPIEAPPPPPAAPPPPPLPGTPQGASAASDAANRAAMARGSGSTIITGPQGLTDQASTTKKALTGA